MARTVTVKHSIQVEHVKSDRGHEYVLMVAGHPACVISSEEELAITDAVIRLLRAATATSFHSSSAPS